MIALAAEPGGPASKNFTYLAFSSSLLRKSGRWGQLVYHVDMNPFFGSLARVEMAAHPCAGSSFFPVCVGASTGVHAHENPAQAARLHLSIFCVEGQGVGEVN